MALRVSHALIVAAYVSTEEWTEARRVGGETRCTQGPLIGTIITQAPNDTGVTNFVATVDPATGYFTPFAIGFGKATGMLFVPSA